MPSRSGWSVRLFLSGELVSNSYEFSLRLPSTSDNESCFRFWSILGLVESFGIDLSWLNVNMTLFDIFLVSSWDSLYRIGLWSTSINNSLADSTFSSSCFLLSIACEILIVVPSQLILLIGVVFCLLTICLSLLKVLTPDVWLFGDVVFSIFSVLTLSSENTFVISLLPLSLLLWVTSLPWDGVDVFLTCILLLFLFLLRLRCLMKSFRGCPFLIWNDGPFLGGDRFFFLLWDYGCDGFFISESIRSTSISLTSSNSGSTQVFGWMGVTVEPPYWVARFWLLCSSVYWSFSKFNCIIGTGNLLPPKDLVSTVLAGENSFIFSINKPSWDIDL